MSAYKLVPVEPTQDMIDAGVDAACVDISEKAAAWIYEAMLAAAPEAGECCKYSFWVVYDATSDQKYIKMDSGTGCLAFFDTERQAAIFAADCAGADYKELVLYSCPQPAPAVQGESVATVTEEVFGSDGTSDFISARLPVGTKLYTAPQQPDPFRGDNVALIRSAQSLLSLDDKGALGPNGIGGHARNIITAFIARISAEQQPAPDVAGLVEALEEITKWVERWITPDHPIATAARTALDAHRKQGVSNG